VIYLCQSILKVNVDIEKAELKPPKWCSLLGRVETLSMADGLNLQSSGPLSTKIMAATRKSAEQNDHTKSPL
jgi:hypothetical protein